MIAPSTAPVSDIHVHTTVSDGRLQPEAVIELAAASGVDRIVITDHSVVTFDEGLVGRAAAAGVEMPFPGTEVSTMHRGRKHHVTLYGRGLLGEELRRYISLPIERKNDRARQVIDVLRGELPALDFDEVRRGASDEGDRHPERAYVSRGTIARHVADRYGMPMDEATARVHDVDRQLRERGVGEPQALPTADLLKRATEAGIAACSAHPMWEIPTGRATRAELYEDLRTFRSEGLFGIEVQSYHHEALNKDAELLQLAADLGLVVVGGSDFHGNGRVTLGAHAEPEGFERLRGKVEAGEAG